MLYSVFPMAHNPIRSMDRRVRFSTDRLMWQIEPSSFSHHDNEYKDILLGVKSSEIPAETYKAIYISNDSNYVFEVVYTIERGLERCIYVKMIQSQVTIGISLDTILHYSESPAKVVSLNTIISTSNWMRDSSITNQDLQTVVPAIFGRESLDHEIIKILGATDDTAFKNIVANTWEPLYYHEPNILGALIKGTFLRPPHTEIQGVFPLLNLFKRKGDAAYNLSYRAKALGGRIYCDQSEFDPAILFLLQLPIAEISFSISFTDGLEGVVQTGVLHYLNDPYQVILPVPMIDQDSLIKTIGGLVQELLWIYSQVFDCDLYGRIHEKDKSYITIHKNMFDEVIFEFHDTVENNHVGIYNNLVSLSLVTQGVGHKDRAM